MARRPVCLVCLLLMCLLPVLDRMGIPLLGENPLSAPVRSWIREHPESSLWGEVEQCAETEYSQSVYLKNTFLIEQSQKISLENVRVFLKEKEILPVGARVLVSGKLEEIQPPGNPGEFDSRHYYACRHTYYFLKNAKVEKRIGNGSPYRRFMAGLRTRIAGIFRASAGEDAPLFEAMFLGDRSGMEDEVRMRYQMAGYAHLLSISGLHISLLGMGLYHLLQFAGLPIPGAGLLSLAVMLQYGMMTGGSVATMRAVCMFLIFIGAKLLWRIYDMLTALAAAAILLLLDTPAYLRDCGFLLSFGAVVGMGVLLPVLAESCGAEKGVLRSILASLSVQLVTLPVVLWFYGEVSLAGIFLNLAVLPTAAGVLASGAAGALAGLISLRAAVFALAPGRLLLAVYHWLAWLAGRLPFCTWIAGKPRMRQMFIYYIILTAAAGALYVYTEAGKKQSRRSEGSREKRKRALRGGLLFALVMCAAAALLVYHRRPELRITCLDVGQGDCIAVEAPGDRCFLLDGGSSDKGSVGQYQILPCLKSQGISRLDAILVSHTDEDHISGIRELLFFVKERLTSLRVGKLILPAWEKPPEACFELEQLAREAGVQVIRAKAGDVLKAGDVRFRVLSPQNGGGEDVNEDGMVLELEYGEFRGLFTGDIGEKAEESLLPVLRDVDFLKVAHHGSRYSSSAAFLEKVRPELGVISCSDTNTYGHPAPETVERLAHAGCRVEYTMTGGAVTVHTDGNRMWWECFRKGRKG